MLRLFFLFGVLSFLIAAATAHPLQGRRFQLSGTVTNTAGEPLVGAYVLINPGNTTVATDENGRFRAVLERGTYQLQCQYLGVEKITKEVVLNRDVVVGLRMQTKSANLQQVEITTKPSMDVQSTNMGMAYMDIRTLAKMPSLLGEIDVIRSVSSLPGVVNAGEGTSGFYVRGGSADQNLVLMDDAPVFNSSHLFGFFSVYNPDVLKSYTLHRSGISAKYGSRISSILDVNLREGDNEEPHFFAGVSPVTAKVGYEGPVGQNLTVLVAGRAAYPTYLMALFKNENIRNSSAHFYDANLKATYRPNLNNTITLSTYHSADGFKFPFDTTYHWTNTLASLKWNHLYSQNLSSTVTAVKSIYNNNVEGIAIGEEFNLSSGIDFSQVKMDFGYFGIPKHQVDFGAGLSHYDIQPGDLKPYGTSSLNPLRLQQDIGSEYHAYVNDEVILSKRVSFSIGLRGSFFAKTGPSQVYLYEIGKPRSEGSLTDTLTYGRGDVVESFGGLEPRASVKVSLSDNSSVKAGYARTRQYIQLISNTAAVTPVDVWKLSNNYLEPQIADQVSVGYFLVKPENTYGFSWEIYYKRLYNQLDYKDGAEILLNPTLEADLLSGDGTAYGSEWLLKKNTGRLTGWVSLSYSRSFRTIAGATPDETINNGDPYPSNFDKPINLNLFGNYQLNPAWSFSSNFTYSTGRPITASDSWYSYYGQIYSNYYGRNQERMPDYHRLDVSLNYEFKKRKRVESTGSISVYNLYFRRNAYSTLFKHYYGAPPGAYKLAVIGVAIPSVNYNIKF